MLKFDLDIHFVVIQKLIAAVYEKMIFRDFSGGQSPEFS